jgi:CHAT domain-containing protein
VVRNGEGVYGLRRAFFLAGAETLVMSLWPVSDLVTRDTMTGYYSGLKDGLGRGAALHRAQLRLMRQPGAGIRSIGPASFRLANGRTSPVSGKC